MRLVQHPVTLAALAVLLINDHYLKAAAPSVLTGKLSDFAGLIVLAVFCAGFLQYLMLRELTGRELALVGTLCAIAFAAIKTTPICAQAYVAFYSEVHWFAGALLDLALGSQVRAMTSVAFVMDPTDLIALPCALIPAWLQHHAGGRASEKSEELD